MDGPARSTLLQPRRLATASTSLVSKPLIPSTQAARENMTARRVRPRRRPSQCAEDIRLCSSRSTRTYGHLLPDAVEYERGLLDAFDARENEAAAVEK